MNGAWQSIATAPRDGTAILAINGYLGQVPVVVRWKASEEIPEEDEDIDDAPLWVDAATRDGSALHFNGRYFAYWQPLPLPPTYPVHP